MIIKYGGGRRIKIFFLTFLLNLFLCPYFAMAEEVDVLEYRLPIEYILPQGVNPAAATDRNSSTSIVFQSYFQYSLYELDRTEHISSYATTTGGGSDGGRLELLDPNRAVVASIFLPKKTSVPKTSVDINNVKYIRIMKNSNDQNAYSIYELYVWAEMGDTTPPLIPSGLQVEVLGLSSLRLTWNANTEEDLAGYYVFRDSNQIADVTETFYEDTSLEPGHTYTYAVKAYDTSLNVSDFSEQLQVTMPIAPPKPILNVGVTGKLISMSWNGQAETFKVLVNGEVVATTPQLSYEYNANKAGNYSIQVVAVNPFAETPSDVVNVRVSSMTMPGEMVVNLIENMGLVLYPIGGLIALALALKASPTLIAIAKAFMMRRFF